jgi:hypothetical protein
VEVADGSVGASALRQIPQSSAMKAVGETLRLCPLAHRNFLFLGCRAEGKNWFVVDYSAVGVGTTDPEPLGTRFTEVS